VANGWTDEDETWRAGRPWHWPHCVRWGPRSPSSKGDSPKFLVHIWCGQMAGWIKMPLGMEVGRGPGKCVRWAPSSPLQKRGTAPQFSVHCGQTAGWMKMPLGTGVDLGPGHIVLDGDRAPPATGAQQPPLFSAHVYCGHGCPSPILLSCCTNGCPKMLPTFCITMPSMVGISHCTLPD